VSCELAGATLGLIGLGSIGREFAGRVSALSMRVIGAREHAEREKPLWIEEVFTSDRLDQMLAQSDYVLLAAPLSHCRKTHRYGISTIC
jgi:phosphoglycerate dehydrogenase-like enzyme